MSDTGLFGSIYEQLRQCADRFDRALVRLNSHDGKAVDAARKELADLLRDIARAESGQPSARLVALVLRRELSQTYGEGLNVCEAVATSLDRDELSEEDLSKLEHIAATLDSECSETMARLRGRV